ncbi:hypothetical protein WAI453_001773 [Rhynchosporium graminicola]|uniref:Mitochondrial pyruvate carrier n=1 Tax=Rhynchosporium graminicola TaxID=2792576 RepID=A0A1E1LPK0_9HELO|nr:related to FMP43 Found in Mitochondrial Proteome [Rhynchosporium commune]
MSAPSTLMRAARPAFRSQFFNSQTTGAFRASRNSKFGGYGRTGKRWQSTAAPEAAAQSWFRRMWDSPIGLKTVHFWAPVMKWSIVLAGISDMYKPVENLSLTQNAALTATGLIWTRWCLIIKPRNILLATVNFFLGMVGIIQVGRITMHNYSKGKSAGDQIEEAKESVKDTAAGLKEDVKETAIGLKQEAKKVVKS